MSSQKRERPDAVPGVTQKISTGWGEVYVVVTTDEDDMPFEVFVTTGKSGGLFNAQAEALGKTLSNALRSGTDPEVLADDLAGIRSDRTQVDNGDVIRSIPDAVGIAMKRVIEDKVCEPIRGDAGGEDGPGDEGPEAPL